MDDPFEVRARARLSSRPARRKLGRAVLAHVARAQLKRGLEPAHWPDATPPPRSPLVSDDALARSMAHARISSLSTLSLTLVSLSFSLSCYERKKKESTKGCRKYSFSRDRGR